MVCSRCGKSLASQFNVRVNGTQKTLCLCATCYDALYGGRGEHDLFYGEKASKTVGACSTCGTTYAQYAKSGLVGCSDCYSALREQLTPIIERLQGSTFHVGKSPTRGEVDYPQMRALVSEREFIKEEMERALREGKFDRAEGLKERLICIKHKLYREEKE